MYTRPFHENTFFLEIQDAQSELLVLGPIETNVRKCVFSQICLLPLELDPPYRALEGGQFRFWSNLKVPFYVYLWHRSVILDILSHI